MRLRLLLSGLVVAILAAAGGRAAADPLNSPKSMMIVAACDSGPIALTVLTSPPSAAAWTLTTSVGIAVAVMVTDDATGEVIFQFDNAGFDKSAVVTETCAITIPGAIVTIEAFFTPANR